MANEILIAAGISVFKQAVMDATLGMAIPNGVFSMSGSFSIKNTMSVGTTPTIIPLGQVSSPHWAFFKNVDPTNFITIFNGVSGSSFLKLYPGEGHPAALDETGTYYAMADSADANLQYLIASL